MMVIRSWCYLPQGLAYRIFFFFYFIFWMYNQIDAGNLKADMVGLGLQMGIKSSH